MRTDFRSHNLAWALLIALAISLTLAPGVAAEPRNGAAQAAETSRWTEAWSAFRSWLWQPIAALATGSSGEVPAPSESQSSSPPETDDGPDMDPDG